MTEVADTTARHGGLFGRRAARRAADTAHARHRETQARVRSRWGSTPTGGDARSWVKAVAARAAEAAPELVTARADADLAKAGQRALVRQQERERLSADAQVYGQAAKYRVPARTAAARADQWRRQADAARAELACLQAMPLQDAARMIEQDEAARAEARVKREAADSARRTPGPWTQPRRPASGHTASGCDLSQPRPSIGLSIACQTPAFQGSDVSARWYSRLVPDWGNRCQ